jgi:hypothetical protein
MNQCPLTFIDHRSPDIAVGVIGGSDQFDVRPLFTIALRSSCPFVEAWLQAVRHGWVGLQVNCELTYVKHVIFTRAEYQIKPKNTEVLTNDFKHKTLKITFTTLQHFFNQKAKSTI